LKIGIWAFFTDRWPVSITELATAVESRGFESLWLGEHTHIPTAGSSFPEEMAVNYVARLPDPFILLASAAAVTSRLRLGTAISLAAEYEPIGLAHLVATLDFVSGGRFEFGIGYGSNPAEIRNRGLDVRNRRAILREKVLAMIELWTHDVASFEGRFVRFAESWSWPKPVQQPHPPILLGSDPPSAYPHVVEFCDGWLPHPGPSDEAFRQRVADLHRVAESAGRDPSTIGITVTVPAETPSQRRPDFFGSPETLEEIVEHGITRADVDRYATLGIDRIIVTLNRPKPELLEPVLDQLANLLP
jgi:probable F420-dependent oxidoreductase